MKHAVSGASHRNKIDEFAKNKGHYVLRLPPYHCELNPIEMVWAQVKYYVEMHNTTFKQGDMEQLVVESYQNVTVNNWQNYIGHLANLQDDVEEFIINVTHSSSKQDSLSN